MFPVADSITFAATAGGGWPHWNAFANTAPSRYTGNNGFVAEDIVDYELSQVNKLVLPMTNENATLFAGIKGSTMLELLKALFMQLCSLEIFKSAVPKASVL